MKKIYPVLVFFFCFDAYAARTPFGLALETQPMAPNYLVDVADAWNSIAVGMGPSAHITQLMTVTHSADIPMFRDIVSTIAYNETPLIIFNTLQYVNAAFASIARPLESRRTDCVWEDGKCNVQKQSVIIDGRIFGNVSSFDSEFNGNFDTRTGGVSIGARGYLSKGFVVGVSYARALTDTKNNAVYVDATTNSVTAFAKYLSTGGVFINGGVNIGKTSWTTDKSVAGIQTPKDYDSEFLSGQLMTGVKVDRGPVFIVPQFGARYVYLTSEKHTDAVVQTFKEWHRNTLSGIADVQFGTEFMGNDFSFRPSILLGGSYDMLSNGSNDVQVQLINGSTYFIPVDVPNKAAFNAGIGLDFNGPMFSVCVNYKLDFRKDFMAHTAMASLKLSF